jgi:hypothetical protein
MRRSYDLRVEQSLRRLLLAYADGSCTGAEAARWAKDALLRGLDTPALRVLAGVHEGCRQDELEGDLRRAATEIGISWSGQDVAELRRALLCDLAAEILAEDAPIGPLLDRIHREILVPLGHPEDLRAWCWLWEGNHPVRWTVIDQRERDDLARELAKRTLHR